MLFECSYFLCFPCLLLFVFKTRPEGTFSDLFIPVFVSEWLKIQYRTTEPEPELLKALNSVLFRTLAESFVKAENTQEIVSN